MMTGSTKLLLAGATGLAGSAILRRLLADDDCLSIRAGYFSELNPLIDDPRITYMTADLRRSEDCLNLAEGCDTAILAAAIAGGAQQNVSEPWRQLTDNLVMDTVMLDAFHKAGVRRVVFVSSATVYPERDGFLKESDLDWNEPPPNAYLGVGYAKRAAETLCRFWHERAGMETIVVRASNIFGPYAKFDPATSNFIPALIRKAVARQDPFEVWGSPNVTRDVIYADDFADAIVRLVRAGDIKHDTFNLGSGSPITVEAVVEEILAACDYASARVIWSQTGPVTIRTRALDCSKLTARTGWSAGIGVKRGIYRTAKWWQENQHSWIR